MPPKFLKEGLHGLRALFQFSSLQEQGHPFRGGGLQEQKDQVITPIPKCKVVGTLGIRSFGTVIPSDAMDLKGITQKLENGRKNGNAFYQIALRIDPETPRFFFLKIQDQVLPFIVSERAEKGRILFLGDSLPVQVVHEFIGDAVVDRRLARVALYEIPNQVPPSSVAENLPQNRKVSAQNIFEIPMNGARVNGHAAGGNPLRGDILPGIPQALDEPALKIL